MKRNSDFYQVAFTCEDIQKLLSDVFGKASATLCVWEKNKVRMWGDVGTLSLSCVPYCGLFRAEILSPDKTKKRSGPHYQVHLWLHEPNNSLWIRIDFHEPFGKTQVHRFCAILGRKGEWEPCGL